MPAAGGAAGAAKRKPVIQGDRAIVGKIWSGKDDFTEGLLAHQMNPSTDKVVVNRKEILMNPEFLITVSHQTHNAIHYGDERFVICDAISGRKQKALALENSICYTFPIFRRGAWLYGTCPDEVSKLQCRS